SSGLGAGGTTCFTRPSRSSTSYPRETYWGGTLLSSTVTPLSLTKRYSSAASTLATEPAIHATTTGYQNFLYITGPPCPDYLRRLPLSDAVLISIGLHCGQVFAQLRVILKEGQNLGQRND